MHVIAAKAVALGEALQPEFKRYAGQVIENAQAMCQQLAQRGLTLLTGGTDCHLGIIDLRPQVNRRSGGILSRTGGDHGQ